MLSALETFRKISQRSKILSLLSLLIMIVFSVLLAAVGTWAVILFANIDSNRENMTPGVDALHTEKIRGGEVNSLTNLFTRIYDLRHHRRHSHAMMNRPNDPKCQHWYKEFSPGFVVIPDNNSDRDPEIGMTACQIARRWGYPCQNHSVTTNDGYILTVHRIPHGRNRSRPGRTPAYPVLLQHGLVGSSVDWIVNLPNQSLGFMLADQGFDVWLGNFRGNYFSRGHTTLNPESRLFWEFSFDQMASQDLPAMINHVLANNNSTDLFYIGHSEGTTAAFAELSKNKELSNKVKTFFALAPVTTVGHIKQIVYATLAPFAEEIRDILYDAGLKGEVFPRNIYPVKWLNDNVCSQKSLRIICKEVLLLFGGFACGDAINVTRIPVYNDHTPAGTSLQNLVHFGQLIRSDNFQMYDYGSAVENRNHYGQDTPPEYDVAAVSTPLAVYWGGLDTLADPDDVEDLFKKLRHVEHVKYIENFGHTEMIWALTAPRMVFDDIISVMRTKLTKR